MPMKERAKKKHEVTPRVNTLLPGVNTPLTPHMNLTLITHINTHFYHMWTVVIFYLC